MGSKPILRVQFVRDPFAKNQTFFTKKKDRCRESQYLTFCEISIYTFLKCL